MKSLHLLGCGMWVLGVALAGAACGKKGAPIPPPVRIPAAVETLAALRLGNDVFVTLTVPPTNIDMSIPVDIGRIEVYGYTGRLAPPRLRWAELGTRIATIEIPAVPLDYKAPSPQAAAAAALAPTAMPGTPITIRDTLTPDEFEQGQVYVDPRQKDLPVPAPAVALPLVMRRFYLAIPFSRRGRPGPPGAQAEMVLTSLPDPPSDLRAAYAGPALSLTWYPSGGVLGFLLDRGLAPEPTPFVPTPQPGPVAAPAATMPDTAVPPGPTTYNVYRQISPDPLELPRRTTMPQETTLVPQPLNAAPLSATSATDRAVVGREQCYVVRAQRGTVLSEPSQPACAVVVDLVPPAAPAGLAAVPSEGGISLIWEPNGELDLAGYLVLRHEPGDATLRQLTDTPIAEARYRDADVRAGARYVYSVVAVDNRVPLPNVSAPSAPVEETAR